MPVLYFSIPRLSQKNTKIVIAKKNHHALRLVVDAFDVFVIPFIFRIAAKTDYAKAPRCSSEVIIHLMKIVSLQFFIILALPNHLACIVQSTKIAPESRCIND